MTEINSGISYEYFSSLHPGVIVAEEVFGKWSDRDLAKKHGRLSAIEVEEEHHGWHIHRLRARWFPPQSPTPLPRYGADYWAPWRETGWEYTNPRPPRQLVLPTRCRLAGYFDKKTGMLCSLSVKNLDNDEEQIVGEHETQNNRLLTSSPLFVDPTSDLSHLSGDEELDKRNLTFNFQK